MSFASDAFTPAPPQPSAPRTRGRGNPNLAPRCGAKARTTGCPCQSPAMANGRCRMHGGNCHGPSTPEGKARMTAANTKHGFLTGPRRAKRRYIRTLITRNRLLCDARLLWPYLPPEMAARLGEFPDELATPIHPTHLGFYIPPDAMPHTVSDDPPDPATSTTHRAKHTPSPTLRAAERQAAEAEAASQAPWRQAIA